MSEHTDSYRSSKRSLPEDDHPPRHDDRPRDSDRDSYRRRYNEDEDRRSSHHDDRRSGSSEHRGSSGSRSYEDRPRYDRDRRDDRPRRDDRGGGDRGDRGGDRSRFDDEAPPAVASIHQGRVVSIKPFGAFIELPGFRRHGLLHISQISTSRVDRVEDVLNENDPVWVKVLSVDNQRKLGLSMKFIDQRDGTDSDPDNSQQPARRSGGGGGGGRSDFGGGGGRGGRSDYDGGRPSSSSYSRRSPSP